MIHKTCVFIVILFAFLGCSGDSDHSYRDQLNGIKNYVLQEEIKEGSWTQSELDKAYLDYWEIFGGGIWVATEPWATDKWTYDVFQGNDPSKVMNDEFIVKSTNETLKADGDKLVINKAYIIGMSYVGINKEPIVYFPQLGGYYHNVPGVEGRFGKFLGTDFTDVLNAIVRQRRDWGYKVEFDNSGRPFRDSKYKK
jgi:hypothetical protein